jgi:hypothetical protein
MFDTTVQVRIGNIMVDLVDFVSSYNRISRRN